MFCCCHCSVQWRCNQSYFLDYDCNEMKTGNDTRAPYQEATKDADKKYPNQHCAMSSQQILCVLIKHFDEYISHVLLLQDAILRFPAVLVLYVDHFDTLVNPDTKRQYIHAPSVISLPSHQPTPQQNAPAVPFAPDKQLDLCSVIAFEGADLASGGYTGYTRVCGNWSNVSTTPPSTVQQTEVHGTELHTIMYWLKDHSQNQVCFHSNNPTTITMIRCLVVTVCHLLNMTL